MSERYQKIYQLARRLYASQAPVLIESGALLLEQRSNAMLCQLCFRNIQARTVKSLRAEVQMLDEQGQPLGKRLGHRYLDLDLKREQQCGKDSALVLPSDLARSFTVRLTQVSFDNGEIWTDEKAEWKELPEQKILADYCGNEAEEKRFLRRFGKDCLYGPLETEELWFCTCGAVNRNTESRCHRCRLRRSALLGKAAEAPTAEELEEVRIFAGEAEEEPKPRQKRGLILGAAAALALLGLLAVLLIPRLKNPSQAAPVSGSRPSAAPEVQTAAAAPGPAEEAEPAEELPTDPQAEAYAQALALQEKAHYAPLEDAPGLYADAAEAFEALGDYEDCAERAQLCREEMSSHRRSLYQPDYEDAAALLEAGHYAEARLAFLALGDYEDSAEQALEAVFRKGEALFQYLNSHSIKGVKAELSVDTETESLVALPRDQLLKLGSSGLAELQDCFGADPVRFVSAEEGEVPSLSLEEATAQLLRPLGDYRNSAEMAALLPEMVDRSDEFFALCAAGELEEARDWLNAWQRPFEDRDLWLERMERFLPYCGEWEHLVGDPALVSTAEGGVEKIYHLRCQVMLTPEGATLRFLLHEGDETGPELFAGLEESRFLLHNPGMTYLAQLSNSGSLTVIKLKDGNSVGGVEYVR